MDSDDMGQVIKSYNNLQMVYEAVKRLQYFSTSPDTHSSKSLFRQGLESSLDMALAEICKFRGYIVWRSEPDPEEVHYNELAQAIGRFVNRMINVELMLN